MQLKFNLKKNQVCSLTEEKVTYFGKLINLFLSLQDVITDLNAESETLPLNPPKEDWLGHKVKALNFPQSCLLFKYLFLKK